ncbi:MAG: WYL domain-containing protein [Deltaproteobacteria bacterium]|nr:WYL domain-containing protein [Deltaproteobacteria bacterium]
MGAQLFLERFLWFDAEVRKNRFPNASTLARQCECSAKTAQRSIEFFRDRMSAPLEYDAVRKGFSYSDPHYQIPVLRLSEKELLSLLISKKLLSDAAAGPLSDDLDHVVARLGAILAENVPTKVRPDKTFSFRSIEFSPTNPALFSHISNALLTSRLLTFSYYSPVRHSSTTRTVEPHHLTNYMGTWHLIAFCRLRQGWRDFLLSRISDCCLAGEEFTPRPETRWKPLLTDTFGIFQNPESFPVVLKFSPVRSRWIRGQVWHPDQIAEELPDGSLQLTLPVSHDAEIMMEILKHGSHVQVLEPQRLREKVRDEAEKMSKNNQT